MMKKPNQRLKVFLSRSFDPPDDQRFLSLLDPAIELATGPELPAPADYQVLVAGRPKSEQLAASPHLKILVVPWAGLPEETSQLLADYPHLKVHNLHHNALMVAELGLALLLAVAKQIVPFDQSLRKHDWRRRYAPHTTTQLAGKRALILGYGAIGGRLGVMLDALGMEVMAVRRDPHQPLLAGAPDRVYGEQHILQLLPKAQVLLVALPLTEHTRGLLGAEQLALLPKGALLVNIGRGPIIDQKALFQALQSGRLGGAGLDVWYNYPQGESGRGQTPPADYPFHELENVVLSPHRGGLALETEHQRAEALAQLLNAVARDEPIPNPVDVQAGY